MSKKNILGNQSKKRNRLLYVILISMIYIGCQKSKTNLDYSFDTIHITVFPSENLLGVKNPVVDNILITSKKKLYVRGYLNNKYNLYISCLFDSLMDAINIFIDSLQHENKIINSQSEYPGFIKIRFSVQKDSSIYKIQNTKYYLPKNFNNLIEVLKSNFNNLDFAIAHNKNIELKINKVDSSFIPKIPR